MANFVPLEAQVKQSRSDGKSYHDEVHGILRLKAFLTGGVAKKKYQGRATPIRPKKPTLFQNSRKPA